MSYIPTDLICTECDTGAHFEQARYICVDCDAKLCLRCWDTVHSRHSSSSTSHIQYPITMPSPARQLAPAPQTPLTRSPFLHDSLPPPVEPVLSPPQPTPQRRRKGIEVPPRPRTPSSSEDSDDEEPKAHEFQEHPHHYMPRGNDAIPPRYMTVTAALNLAMKHKNCKGITYKGHPEKNCKVHVFFKTKVIMRRGGWTTWTRGDNETATLKQDTAVPLPLPVAVAEPPQASSTEVVKPTTQTKEPHYLPIESGRETWLPESMSQPKGNYAGGITRALLVGCDYHGTTGKLPDTMKALSCLRQLLSSTGMQCEVRALTESNPSAPPTRSNVMSALRWLIEGVMPGSILFLSFIGHGGHLSFAPVDHDTAGLITNKEIDDILKEMPRGSKLVMLNDFCMGGSLIDLPYRLTMQDRTLSTIHTPQKPCDPVVVMLSGNRAMQQDCVVSGLTMTGFVGALHQLKRPTYQEILQTAVSIMRQTGERMPVLEVSSSHSITPTSEFFLSIVPAAKDREDELINEIFALTDLDKDGLLGYTDMVYLCSNLGKKLTPVAYENMCEWCSTNSTGLTQQHLKKVYKELGAGRGIQHDLEMLKSMRVEQAAERSRATFYPAAASSSRHSSYSPSSSSSSGSSAARQAREEKKKKKKKKKMQDKKEKKDKKERKKKKDVTETEYSTEGESERRGDEKKQKEAEEPRAEKQKKEEEKESKEKQEKPEPKQIESKKEDERPKVGEETKNESEAPGKKNVESKKDPEVKDKNEKSGGSKSEDEAVENEKAQKEKGEKKDGKESKNEKEAVENETKNENEKKDEKESKSEKVPEPEEVTDDNETLRKKGVETRNDLKAKDEAPEEEKVPESKTEKAAKKKKGENNAKEPESQEVNNENEAPEKKKKAKDEDAPPTEKKKNKNKPPPPPLYPEAHDPYNEVAGAGSPASKKNTAVALDNEEIDLDKF
eukprot:TRINITY_DN15636_c0_g1_i1.p1 TRINITY_DN15636_c0_g1~~TRINITY_DN15636_c0_g1_i1.p1  ORF type:complete len:1074 (+),score=312.71 TRINITY_DN15636_c0_g1_i1:376-3222(+)